MKANVIAILGPVGAGKSTIINILIKQLRENRLKVKSAYIKAFHGPSFALWKLISYVIAHKEDNKLAPWYVIGKVNPEVAKLLLLVSTYLDSITIPFMLMLKVMLPKFCGADILIEEYLPGTLLDYIYSFYKLERTGYDHFLPFRILRSLSIKYKPDVTALLDADLPILKKHWGERGYGDPQIEYVLFQRRILPKLLQALNYEGRIIKFKITSAQATSIANQIRSLLTTNALKENVRTNSRM